MDENTTTTQNEEVKTQEPQKIMHTLPGLLFILFALYNFYTYVTVHKIALTMIIEISVNAVYIFAFLFAGYTLLYKPKKKSNLQLAFALEPVIILYYLIFYFNSFIFSFSNILHFLQPISMVILIGLSYKNKELAKKVFFVPAALWLLSYILSASYKYIPEYFTSLDGILGFLSTICYVGGYFLVGFWVTRIDDDENKTSKQIASKISIAWIAIIIWIAFLYVVLLIAHAQAKEMEKQYTSPNDGKVRDLNGDGKVDNREWEKQWNDFLDNQYDKYGV